MEIQDWFKTRCTDVEKLFSGIYPEKESDLMNYRMRKIILVSNLLHSLELSWNQLFSLFRTHTFVHPKIAEHLKNGDDEIECLLAQGFVRNEKLVRVLKNVSDKNDRLLAVDGLGGNISNGPNFDHKYYLHNLKFEEPQSTFDEDPAYKRRHCLAVRLMYDVLSRYQASKHIYTILRNIIREVVGVELPAIVEFREQLPKEIEEKCKIRYLSEMKKNEIEDVYKSIKWKGEKRNGDENPSPSKRMKNDKDD